MVGKISPDPDPKMGTRIETGNLTRP